MTTKIISSSDRMNDKTISGTLEQPVIRPLIPGQHNHAAIIDHGSFAVFEYMGYNGGYEVRYVSIVLDKDHPTLDLKTHPKTEYLYLDTTYKKFEFTPKGGHKER